MHDIHTFLFFFFNDTATTEIYTLSLHDALPILAAKRDEPWMGCVSAPGPRSRESRSSGRGRYTASGRTGRRVGSRLAARSEEHTSELQSRQYLVCRLLLEKKKKQHQLTYQQKRH